MIPQPFRDRVDELRRLRDNCAICELSLDAKGPAIFFSGSGDATRHAHVACVDWTERPSPVRDLLRRIRSTRRKAAELDRTMAIAERIALQLERDWMEHANDRDRLRRLALKYFKLLERIRAVVNEALGGW